MIHFFVLPFGRCLLSYLSLIIFEDALEAVAYVAACIVRVMERDVPAGLAVVLFQFPPTLAAVPHWK